MEYHFYSPLEKHRKTNRIIKIKNKTDLYTNRYIDGLIYSLFYESIQRIYTFGYFIIVVIIVEPREKYFCFLREKFVNYHGIVCQVFNSVT